MRLGALLDLRRAASISSSSTCRRPAVSTISTSRPLGLRLPERPLGDVDRVALGPLLDRRSRRRARPASRAARRRPGAACRRRRGRPSCRPSPSSLRELRAGGRLARALQARPSGSRSVPVGAKASSRPAPPISSASSSLTIFTTCWPGSRRSSTPAPRQRSLTCGGELLDDLEVDVGLEQREADLAHRLVDVGLGQLSARADVGERRLEAVGELVEHAAMQLTALDAARRLVAGAGVLRGR